MLVNIYCMLSKIQLAENINVWRLAKDIMGEAGRN